MAINSKKRKKLWSKIQICFVCRQRIKKYEESSLEHVIPKSKGGSSGLRNLTLSHRKCNSMRGNIVCRLIWEINLKFDQKPRKNLWNKTPKEIERAWLEKMMKRLERQQKGRRYLLEEEEQTA